MFDLNPLEPLGIDPIDLEFAHLFIMFLSKKEDFNYTFDMQSNAVKNHKNAALLDLKDVEIDGVPIIRKAESIINEMIEFFEGDKRALKTIEYEKIKLNDRLCDKVKAGDIYR